MYTIFGSTGFIGKEIIKFLKKKNIKIYIPKRNQIKFNKNLGNIIYCVGSDNWKENIKDGFYSNLGHLQKILFNSKYKSFLFLSSSRVYIHQNSKTSEEEYIKIKSDDLNDFYNLLKLTSESLCLSLNNNKIKVIRLSNVLGNNYSSPLVLPTLIRNGIQRGKIKLFINKNSTKDYIGIDDVTQLIFKIINHGKERIYNVASGKNTKLIEIVKIIRNETNCRITLINQKEKILEPIINISRIKKEFKFNPKIKFKNDLKKIINNFKIFLKKY
tara:strand:+ start:2231 stop:3046 length:816 start_codon:yes stop_codon:yes gene_type:complete